MGNGDKGPPAKPTYCASCGVRLVGPWCAQCGERERKPGGASIREYLGELVEALSNLDGRFWGSLRALLFRPGLLTAEYLAGRRVNWMRPLHLFLLINLAYFFLTIWNTFSTPLWVHLNLKSPYQPAASAMVNRHLNDPALAASEWEQVTLRMHTPEELDPELRPAQARLQTYNEGFNHNVDLYSRTLIISMIPLLIPPLLFLRRRDGPVRALVFSTHVMALFVLVSLPIGYVASAVIHYGLFGLNLSQTQADTVFSGVMIALLLAWLVPAFRRVWRLAWWQSALVAAGLILWLVLALQIYRALLFFLVFWSMR